MPKKVSPATITIVVDRQEGLPWNFLTVPTNGTTRPKVLIKRAHLKTGDYTLIGQSRNLTIERKSSIDFIKSCTTDHDRFGREHQRLSKIIQAGGFACVIIEDSLTNVCRAADRIRKGNANRIVGTLTSWAIHYTVPWYFTSNRAEAQRIAYDLLLKYYNKL